MLALVTYKFVSHFLWVDYIISYKARAFVLLLLNGCLPIPKT